MKLKRIKSIQHKPEREATRTRKISGNKGTVLPGTISTQRRASTQLNTKLLHKRPPKRLEHFAPNPSFSPGFEDSRRTLASLAFRPKHEDLF